MRITFILPFASLAGGIRVVATYAQMLTDAGHEVFVISQPKRLKGSALRRSFKRIKRRVLGIKPKPTTPLLDFLGPRHIVLDTARAVTSDDVPHGDAVIATWWETAQSVADLPAECGTKLYLVQDYEIFDNQPQDDVANTYSLGLQKIAVSGYIRDCLAQNHDVQDTIVIPNAVDTGQFNAPARTKNKTTTVGFLYHAHPRKQVELAIKAVTLARARNPDLRVIAFGRARPADRFGFPDWIDYRQSPAQSEIPDIYAACDAWLFTSRHEGFGLPLLEAMACRTPVLATRAGAAADLIDGTNGRLLEPDPAAFADAIADFADLGGAQWQALSDRAYNTAHSYTWQDAAEALVETIAAQTP